MVSLTGEALFSANYFNEKQLKRLNDDKKIFYRFDKTTAKI
jgi:hypothetical protein